MGKDRLVRLYSNKTRTTFVASGSTCPRINLGKVGSGRFRDDYSTGIKISKSIVKKIFN